MNIFEKKLFTHPKLQKIKTPLSLVLSLLCYVVVISIGSLIVVPEIATTVLSIKPKLTTFYTTVQNYIINLNYDIPQIQSFLQNLNLDWGSIVKNISNFLQSGVTDVISSTFSVATSVFSGIFNAFMGLVVAIYILLTKETLAKQCKRFLFAFLSEAKAKRFIYIATLTRDNFSSFLTGQCVEAVILGTMFLVTMWIFKLPYALMVSVLIGFMALIPIFGAFIGFFIGAFLMLITNPIQALWFAILFLVLQQIEGNLIYPKVVGNSIGLPALWVLAAVSIGGSLMGVLGMLVFVPMFSVVYTLTGENIEKNLNNKNLPKNLFEPVTTTTVKKNIKSDVKPKIENKQVKK